MSLDVATPTIALSFFAVCAIAAQILVTARREASQREA
jgi:hypothetical protein